MQRSEIPRSYLVFTNSAALKHFAFPQPMAQAHSALRNRDGDPPECRAAAGAGVTSDKLDDLALKQERSSHITYRWDWRAELCYWTAEILQSGVCLRYTSTRRAAVLTSCLSVRTMECIFLMILTESQNSRGWKGPLWVI